MSAIEENEPGYDKLFYGSFNKVWPEPTDEERERIWAALDHIFEQNPEAARQWVHSSWPRAIGLYD